MSLDTPGRRPRQKTFRRHGPVCICLAPDGHAGVKDQVELVAVTHCVRVRGGDFIGTRKGIGQDGVGCRVYLIKVVGVGVGAAWSRDC